MLQGIKEKLFEIDSKKLELDSLQKKFAIECKRFTANSIEGKVRAAIALNHEKAMELGRHGLKPVKNLVNQIINNISDSVEEIINNDALWLHKQEELCSDYFSPGQYSMKGRRGPEILDGEVRKLLSPVGKILIQYKLDTAENWEEKNDYLYYRHNMDWSREMKDCMEQYEEHFNELYGLVKEYESLSRHTRENDALELWDSL